MTKIENIRPSWWPDDWQMGDASHERWHGGGCNALALAIHDQTSWPIYQILDKRGPHTVVRTPDEQLLDHRGYQPWPKGYRHADPSSRAEIARDAEKWGPLEDYPDAPEVAAGLLKAKTGRIDPAALDSWEGWCYNDRHGNQGNSQERTHGSSVQRMSSIVQLQEEEHGSHLSTLSNGSQGQVTSAGNPEVAWVKANHPDWTHTGFNANGHPTYQREDGDGNPHMVTGWLGSGKQKAPLERVTQKVSREFRRCQGGTCSHVFSDMPDESNKQGIMEGAQKEAAHTPYHPGSRVNYQGAPHYVVAAEPYENNTLYDLAHANDGTEQQMVLHDDIDHAATIGKTNNWSFESWNLLTNEYLKRSRIDLIAEDYKRENPDFYPDHTANILDSIHPELTPLVFDDPADPKPKLKPVHRKWLLREINQVLEDGGYEGMDKWLSLVFTGSLTTYQYSDESDVDISLFVDMKQFPEWARGEMIALMVDKMDGTTLPGTPHPMQCFVVPPDVSKEDLYKPGMRSGYDLGTDDWIVPPERGRVHDVQAEMSASYIHALQQADKMESLLKYEPDKAIMLWHQIHKRRRRDMQKGKGDYADSNIVYKMLANRGIFPKLSEISGEYIAHVAAEFHIGLELPKEATKKIQDWVKAQDWPEGTKLEDPKDYHITLVYAEDGHEDHAEDEWRHAEKGYDAEVTGVDLFGKDEEKAIVLKIKSPDVVRHAEDVMDVAEDRGIEINRFPGGYKPHITVAYGPGKPSGKAPKIEFHTGPSSVSEPREKTAADTDISTYALQSALQKGGVTISLDDREPRTGYTFSPFKNFETKVPIANLTRDDIAQFMDTNYQALTQPNNYLGIWVEGSIAYIDVSQNLLDFNAAYKLAWDAEQLSLWDVVNETEIPVRDGGQPPSEIKKGSEWKESATAKKKNSSGDWNISKTTTSSNGLIQESFAPTSTIPIDTSMNYKRSMAADPEWVNSWTEKNGDYLYHRSPAANTESILRDGLIPWNQLGRSEWEQEPDFLPRKDHVYLGTPKGVHHNYGFNQQYFRIDVSKLHPKNLNPDEDAFLFGNTDKAKELGFPHVDDMKNTFGVHPLGVHKSWGDWADANNLHNPEHTAYSLEQTDRIAHRGPIPPEAITPIAEPDLDRVRYKPERRVGGWTFSGK